MNYTLAFQFCVKLIKFQNMEYDLKTHIVVQNSFSSIFKMSKFWNLLFCWTLVISNLAIHIEKTKKPNRHLF
jgi:hypothetical protein